MKDNYREKVILTITISFLSISTIANFFAHESTLYRWS